jgi:hypothetical protein
MVTQGEAQAYSISGRLTDSVTGDPVHGASIEVPGLVETKTDIDGTFTLSLERSGELPLTVKADGYWQRQTHLLTSSSTRIGADIIPVEDRFNLDFFDHVFRDLGDSGTRRWTREPEIDLWTRVFDCRSLNDRGLCMELVATEQQIPPRVEEIANEVLFTDTSQFTGGALDGSRVTRVSHEPGSVISRHEMLQGGKITMAIVRLPNRLSWAWWQDEGGNMVTSHIQINQHHQQARGVFSHELAHALGYNHPLGGDAVPADSIMRDGYFTHPTPNDILHGRILYDRPPGSRTPDKDPASHSINALSVPPPMGGLTETLTN